MRPWVSALAARSGGVRVCMMTRCLHFESEGVGSIWVGESVGAGREQERNMGIPMLESDARLATPPETRVAGEVPL